jgi:hypothetical protein
MAISMPYYRIIRNRDLPDYSVSNYKPQRFALTLEGTEFSDESVLSNYKLLFLEMEKTRCDLMKKVHSNDQFPRPISAIDANKLALKSIRDFEQEMQQVAEEDARIWSQFFEEESE